MTQAFGDALRVLRIVMGLSTRDLAKAANCSPAAVGHVETGRRPPSLEMVAAWDRALGTAPLLATLMDTDGGGDDDDVNRRALMGQLAAVAGLGAASPETVAEVVRGQLLAAVDDGADDDWSAIVAGHSSAIINAPAPNLELRVLADLALARQGIRAGDRDATRAASHLALLQGQCKADRGDAASAQGWYETAIALADHSEDRRLEMWTRARRAVRLVYEDGSTSRVVDAASEALAVSSKPSIGAVECHVGVSSAYARVGDPRARDGMNRSLDLAARVRADEETGFDAAKRVIHNRTYVLSRIGTLAETEQACREAEEAGLPAIWRAQSALDLAYKLVSDGDVAEGVRHASIVVGAVPRHHRTRIFGQMVGELLARVPERRRSKGDVQALRAMTRS